MMTLVFAAALVAQGIVTSSAVQPQDRPAADVRITRAIYGTAERAADVTATVTRLVQPGADEFYATTRWLQVDPIPFQTKSLVVYYEYRGQPRVLTTTENAAVSHAILIEHADPPLRRRPVANGAGVVIIHAHYGRGRNFQDVTTRVGQIIRQADGAIVISDSAMLLQPTEVNESLIVTYSYRGTRNTWIAWYGGRISSATLVAYAESGDQALQYSNAPPVWLQGAQTDSTFFARGGGAGVGRANRREQAISALLTAIAELEAIPSRERVERINPALVATKRALADAQQQIGYSYPPANSPRPEAPNVSSAAHITNAGRSLTTALDELSAANPGRGRNAAATMTRITAAINEAIAALR